MKPPLVLLWQSYNWRGSTVNLNQAWNGASIVNGTIYYGEGSRDGMALGYLWAWDSATGVTKTGFPLQTLNGIGDTPCITGGYISIATSPGYTTGNAYAWDSLSLNIISGFPVSVAAGTLIEGSPIIKNNRMYFCNGDINGTQSYYLYCYDTTNGNLIYKNPLPAYGSISTPFIYKGKIIITNWNSGLRVFCFNESDGSTVPGYPLQLSTSGGTNSSPIAYNDRIYLGSSNWFWAIDINTATVPAPFPLTITAGNIASTAAAGEGKVYFGTAGGFIYGMYLYGIDATTGANITGFPVSVNGNINGPITLANGVAYFGTDEDKIYAVDANNGTILWNYHFYAGATYSGYQYIMPSVAENKLVVTSPLANGVFVFVQPTPTVTPTITETETLTVTETVTPTVTETTTSTFADTSTITAIVTESQTATETISASPTLSTTITQTLTQTLIYTATTTLQITPTITLTSLPPCGDGSNIISYPNPYKGTDGYFNLHLGLCYIADVNVRIYTNSFRKIMDKNFTSIPANKDLKVTTDIINTKAIQASGIYFAVITITPQIGSGYTVKRKVITLVVIN
jgi:outer membrane protein assembly factor BamB